MNIEELRVLLGGWCQSVGGLSAALSEIKSLTDFLEQVLYDEYEPSGVGAQGEFPIRLAHWIGGAESDEEKRSLFLLLGRLIFFGREQMVAGYRTAYSKNIALWLMEVKGLPFFGSDTEARLSAAVAETAFTEITDSFRLGDFFKWNNISAQGPRYTWEQHLGSWDRTTFMEEIMGANSGKPRKSLVLMEDFVGSGRQMESAVKMACSLPESYDVLLCPIVICPDGASRARALAENHGNFNYSPVMELPENTFISEHAIGAEHDHHPLIREALLSLHGKVRGTFGSWPQETPPFGYENTGAVFCKYDNCPDNSLPILHHRSDLGWSPLFPRISRE